jgi:hypothetical protein
LTNPTIGERHFGNIQVILPRDIILSRVIAVVVDLVSATARSSGASAWRLINNDVVFGDSL